MKPWICVSIQSRTTEQTLRDIKSVEADLIEVRLDYREENIDLASLVEAASAPLIGTNRRKDQGGRSSEPEKERVQYLIDAVNQGFRYIS